MDRGLDGVRPGVQGGVPSPGTPKEARCQYHPPQIPPGPSPARHEQERPPLGQGTPLPSEAQWDTPLSGSPQGLWKGAGVRPWKSPFVPKASVFPSLSWADSQPPSRALQGKA